MDDNEVAALIRRLRRTRERAHRLHAIAAQARDTAEELRDTADALRRTAPAHAQKATVPDRETAAVDERVRLRAAPVTTPRRRPADTNDVLRQHVHGHPIQLDDAQQPLIIIVATGHTGPERGPESVII